MVIVLYMRRPFGLQQVAPIFPVIFLKYCEANDVTLDKKTWSKLLTVKCWTVMQHFSPNFALKISDTIPWFLTLTQALPNKIPLN